jgi:hypothetical protein
LTGCIDAGLLRLQSVKQLAGRTPWFDLKRAVHLVRHGGKRVDTAAQDTGTLNAKPGQGTFDCPCHGSRFGP